MHLSNQIKEDLKKINIFPKYNIKEKKNCILHFGVGNFHRAHQAFYVHEIIENNNDISIIGINLKSNTTKKKLEKQDYLYSLVQVSNNQKKIILINSIKEILYGLTQKEKIRDFISSPEIKLITLTVTEKGYHFDTKKNLLFDKEITNDLKDEKLVTVIGHLSFGLIERYKKNKEKIIIMSCDNLSENGSILKNLIRCFLREVEPSCLIWFDQYVEFPLSMVDGIVPNNIKNSHFFNLPYQDDSIVVTEPHREWYIESQNKYLQSLLNNDKIQFVDDVSFYEDIKLKILNASHSALSYIGHLLGYVYIHEVINDKTCYKFISNFLEKEVIPTLHVKNDFDLIQYKNKVLDRFKNTFLEDKLLRIAMDGSYKIPIRIISTFKNNTKSTNYINCILSAWIIYLESSILYKAKNLKDPNKEIFINIYQEDKEKFILNIFNLKNIFKISYNQREYLIKEITKNVNFIKKNSIRDLMKKITEQ